MLTNWFRKKTPPPDATPRGPFAHDPLAAVPLPPTNLEQKRNSQGLLCLRLTLPLGGFRRRVAGWLGYKYEKRVELDELGTLFFERVDGRRSLRQIADDIAGSTGRRREEMRGHVLLFTRELMMRNLILLRLAGPAPGETP